MFICLCNSVTDRAVREAVYGGATSLSAVSEQLGVGQCCGACAKATQEVIAQTLQPVNQQQKEFFNAANCFANLIIPL